MNKLDEIIAEQCGCNDIQEVEKDFDIPTAIIKQCMTAFAQHLLEEAATNAEMIIWQNNDDLELISGRADYIVNHIPLKQAITDTLNKYLKL